MLYAEAAREAYLRNGHKENGVRESGYIMGFDDAMQGKKPKSRDDEDYMLGYNDGLAAGRR